MTGKDRVNLALVITVGVLAILAARGGLTANTWLADVVLSAGGALLGGGLLAIALSSPLSETRRRGHAEGEFRAFGRNQDLGQEYWLKLVHGLGREPETLWFVGNRHGTWIDARHPYRSALATVMQERLNRYGTGTRSGKVVVVVADPAARDAWVGFLKNEVLPGLTREKSLNLIRVGVLRDETMRYSVVAFGRRVVVTTYLSGGRSAESPTFEVDSESTVGQLYLKDVRRISDRVVPDDWSSMA
jgi:hypothetical protein